MSQRIQHVELPVAAVITAGRPGRSSTKAYVNLYRESGTNKVYFGSKTFRNQRNAEAKGNANVGGTFLKAIEVSGEISL